MVRVRASRNERRTSAVVGELRPFDPTDRILGAWTTELAVMDPPELY